MKIKPFRSDIFSIAQTQKFETFNFSKEKILFLQLFLGWYKIHQYKVPAGYKAHLTYFLISAKTYWPV